MKTVACFGSGYGEPGEVAYDAMKEVGRLLAVNGIRVITGGYSGSGMEAPVSGAKHAGGETAGYVLVSREKQPNPYLDKVVWCGRDFVVEPNTDAMQYCLRLGFLLQADGFVASTADQTPGTLIEFLSVVNLNLKFWQDRPKPIVVLEHPPNPSFFVRIANYSKVPFVGRERIPDKAVSWLLERL